ncbi:MAG: P-loop NTPase family protein [Acaryochloridaceae cyanobacterium CSU_3_4]|nr:P-loop NTPase family protein [Acaryochloridaceae cyanobacterium CSU_3_4]
MVAQLETPAIALDDHPFHSTIEGLVQIFTAPHRSFFTTVMAQAFRAAGQGTPVLIIQFLKGGINMGHQHPMQLCQHLDWYRCNLPRCIDTPALEIAEIQAMQDLWQHTQRMVAAGTYSLVVLDELSLALNLDLISEIEVLRLIQERPRHIDMILTGPNMPRSLLDVADQITELRRHIYP